MYKTLCRLLFAEKIQKTNKQPRKNIQSIFNVSLLLDACLSPIRQVKTGLV